MKKYPLLLAGLLLGSLLTIGTARFQHRNQETPFHEHADFALFVNGEKFDFSQDRFMSVEPCVAAERSSLLAWILVPSADAHGEGEKLNSMAHLHNSIGGVTRKPLLLKWITG